MCARDSVRNSGSGKGMRREELGGLVNAAVSLVTLGDEITETPN